MKNIKIVGIPANAGGLYTGTEMTPKILRAAGLINELEKNGVTVSDLGDLNIPSYAPRHNIPPIRNWPSPRIIWEEIYSQSKDWFNDREIQLIIGGDCSIVTGTVHSLYSRYKEDIHLIVIDAHIDSYGPSADMCIGAAGMGLWFLLENNTFLKSLKGFNGNNITILGYQHESEINNNVMKYSLPEIKEKGISQVVQKVLKEVPQNRKILIHLDIDAISKEELHAVYSPSNIGFSILEMTKLLREILADSRTVGLELTEFFPLHDNDGSQSKKLVQMLVEIFRE